MNMPEDLRSDETKFWHGQIDEAVAREREACAKVADDWLVTFGDRKPEHVSAQTWACDAIKDIADEIRKRVPAIPKQAAAETPMSDHVARFWQLLEARHVRIRVDVRRETADGNDHYWDSSSFGDRLAKALVADRTPLMGVQRPEDVAREQTVSPSNPLITIAGIRQFGLAPDGSDLRDLEAAFTRLALPHTGQPQEGEQRVRHNKRGTEYDVIGSAFLQTDTPLTDMEPLVVYRGGDGRLWVRPEKEFTLDRFTLLSAAPASPRAEGEAFACINWAGRCQTQCNYCAALPAPPALVAEKQTGAKP